MLEAEGIQEILEARGDVYARFTPAFQPKAKQTLSEDTLRAFLDFKNNKHWTGLYRSVNKICAEMGKTRTALVRLADETLPIQGRIDFANQNISGIGKGILTAILHVAYPAKYGVWNAASEDALRFLGLMPPKQPGATLGDTYVSFNAVLLEVATALKMNFWDLDALWWSIRPTFGSEGQIQPTKGGKGSSVIAKEKCIIDMKYSVITTTKNANGQITQTIMKAKELQMTEHALEAHIRELLVHQNDRCAITDLPIRYEGDDLQMRPSIDRIDSDGHYSNGNVQVVCRFVNFWKQAMPDDEFRRLLNIVRDPLI